MTPESIGVVFVGLSGLVTALGAYSAQRTRRIGEDRKALRTLSRLYARQLVASDQHMVILERRLARAGEVVPPRPAILEATPDDQRAPDDPAPGPAAATGRHHRG